MNIKVFTFASKHKIFIFTFQPLPTTQNCPRILDSWNFTFESCTSSILVSQIAIHKSRSLLCSSLFIFCCYLLVALAVHLRFGKIHPSSSLSIFFLLSPSCFVVYQSEFHILGRSLLLFLSSVFFKRNINGSTSSFLTNAFHHHPKQIPHHHLCTLLVIQIRPSISSPSTIQQTKIIKTFNRIDILFCLFKSSICMF